jgi:cell division protein FtsB
MYQVQVDEIIELRSENANLKQQINLLQHEIEDLRSNFISKKSKKYEKK